MCALARAEESGVHLPSGSFTRRSVGCMSVHICIEHGMLDACFPHPLFRGLPNLFT